MAEFRRDLPRARSGRPTSIYLPDDVAETLDERRGRRSRSAFLVELIERALLQEDLASMPPPLRDSLVQHGASRIRDTRVWSVVQSQVRPAEGARGGTAPWTVNHRRTEMRGPLVHGWHWLAPGECSGCLAVVRDFPRTVNP